MASSHKPIVAVVDDDQRVLESLEDLLESAGHSVRVFSSATALLENDGLAQIDCLIADIGMPVIDGFELQRLARTARPELPVILITGRHEIADQQRAIAQGNQGFFQKPFSGQALLAAISQALRAAHRGDDP
ncbi:MAG TPA: response regulator [Reyranella sp.]|jgi:FixJ family two-component response regulator|nr:response regulator [Reyranella sp.]